jgi:two-component system sensor histidine kinase YesM
VQNLFDDTTYRYYWVVSLSRAVELTTGGNSSLGVLLVDMNYSSIEQLLSKANSDDSDEYVYLIDGSGTIIYHPKQKQIYSGLYSENNVEAASYDDGTTEEIFCNEERIVTVKTISYTGWKIVSVVPSDTFEMGLTTMKYFVILLVALSLLAVVLINRLVSAGIADPLQKLNRSVEEWEAGNMNPSIYVGGSMEVEHLGRTLRSTVEQNQQLMHDIVIEQEEKRKSELDALQSQINPHFLYNTLDSIVWMIEGEKYDDAVSMITDLASLFRISLSRGKTIITVEDEVKHAVNYMNIQKVRFKNRFSVNFDISSEIMNCCTVKLVLQPLLENAIYYGVEYMDGDGEINVRGYRVYGECDKQGVMNSGDAAAKDSDGEKNPAEGDIILEVEDNGLGMSSDMVEQLMSGALHVRSHGSGVGLRNVDNRISLRFGAPYGIRIDSAPDEGTRVFIRIPYIEYTAENAQALEEGRYEA